MKKMISAVVLIFLVACTVLITRYFYRESPALLYGEQQDNILSVLDNVFDSIAQSRQSEREYTVLLAGDVMLDRGVESKVSKVGVGDWTFPWQGVAEYTNKADIFFFNHEGSMSDVGADTGKEFSFRFDPDAVEGIKYAGADVVSLANNHALDWGRDSLCETTKILKANGIGYVGAGCDSSESDTAYIEDLGDTRVAFMAITEFYKEGYAREATPGLTKFDINSIKEKVSTLKNEGNVDIVFVSIHWGEEYKTRSNSFQQSLGHELVDAGVDVVVGHHPHVVQEVEKYKDGWIIYSLGNFIFDQPFSKETMKGMMAKTTVTSGEVRDIELINFDIGPEYQPQYSEIAS